MKRGRVSSDLPEHERKYTKWWKEDVPEEEEEEEAPPALPPVVPLEDEEEEDPLLPIEEEEEEAAAPEALVLPIPKFGERELGEYDDDEGDDQESTDDRPAPHGSNGFLPPGGPWLRPPAAALDEGADFVFQHTETTYGIGTDSDKTPEIRIFGVTANGNSVLLKTNNFRPYFFARIHGDQDANDIRNKLESLFIRTTNPKRAVPQFVLRMERVYKRSIIGYHRNRALDTMYKITMAHPAHVKTARDALEFANASVSMRKIQTFEANVPFELRYMVDSGLAGCQWIKLPAGSFREVDDVTSAKISTAQYELEMIGQMQPLKIDEAGELAPMRVLSFDIEAKRKERGFVQSTINPAIIICAALHIVGTGVIHKIAFCFTPPGVKVGHVPDADEVLVFHEEYEMLMAFSQYVRECDPECFTGWNISNFDWPYLAGRAKALDIEKEFMKFTRIRGKCAWIREQLFQSKAHGAKKSSELLCEGRFDYDGLLFMHRGQMEKHRSYALNAISKHYLNDQKVDVHHTQIPILHEGSDEDRARLTYYCLRDVLLPLEILDKLMAFVNGIEQSRVTGVPIKWLLSRGQGVKTFSNLFRFKKANEVVPSRSAGSNRVETGGGSVRKPIAGFHKHPIATLDFSSLYPSIMQAYNICYSTKETVAWARANLGPDDYWIPPPATVGGPEPQFCFVKDHIRKGILPDLLTVLLNQRAYVKGLMKKVDKKINKLLYDVLDGRQLAIKLCANSVYGFLKAFLLVDPDLMEAVTSWGREMIATTARIVETHFKDYSIVDRASCEAAGLDYEESELAQIKRLAAAAGLDPAVCAAWAENLKEHTQELAAIGFRERPRMLHSARILYGDTDSIMVDFGDIGIQDVLAYARIASKMCTEHFVKPNSLAVESVKIFSLLMAPKRYASLEILAGDVTPEDTTDSAALRAKLSFKGVESRRRDNALIGSETQQTVLKMILKQRDILGAAEYVKQVISDIWMDRVDLSKFVISKGLSKTEDQYEKGGTKQQHTELKKRIALRANVTGEVVPQTGDRVPYIVIAGTAKKSGKGASKAHELSEDPAYVLKNRVPINKRYYIEKQVMAATLRVFTCVWEPELLGTIESSMSDKTLEGLKAYHVLFKKNLPHMLKRKENKSMAFGIGAYAEILPKCLHAGCNTRLTQRDGSHTVCSNHDATSVRSSLESEMEKRQAASTAAWDICRACAGGGFNQVTCANTTCDNFYHRQTTLIDIEDLQLDLDRFKKPWVAAPVGRGVGCGGTTAAQSYAQKLVAGSNQPTVGPPPQEPPKAVPAKRSALSVLKWDSSKDKKQKTKKK